MTMTKKQEREFIDDAQIKAQPKTITGYQIDPETGEFRGEYSFPNNLDKEEVHLPPNTVLTKPPTLASNESALYVDGQWEKRQKLERRVFVPADDHDLKLSLPVLHKGSIPHPTDPGKTIETVEWVSEQITPEGEAQKAIARRADFERQQREWGLM